MINIPLIPFDQQIRTHIQIHTSLEIQNGIVHLVYQVTDANDDILNFNIISSNKMSFGKESRKNEIWKNTCFEFFVKKSGNKNYYEFNSDSSGNWNFYRFTEYRSPIEIEEKIKEIRMEAHQNKTAKTLHFEVDLNALFQPKDSLLFSFSSIINESGKISYWAHRHSSEKPDFHHVNNFTIEANFK